MKFSVIIPVYNEEERIIPCVKSVLTQTFQDFEIILVDNNSTDNTFEVANNINPEKVRVIKYGKIQSSAAARNAGIAAAKGEIFAFIDADCIAEKHWLENSIKYFDAGAKVLAGAVECGSNKSAIEAFNHLFELNQDDCYKEGYAITANIIVKREMFEDYGMFNPYYVSGEDIAWTCQFADWRPDRFVYAWDVKVKHYARNIKGLFNKAIFRQYHKPREADEFFDSQPQSPRRPLVLNAIHKINHFAQFFLCWAAVRTGSFIGIKKRKIKRILDAKKYNEKPNVFSQRDWDIWGKEFERFYEILDGKLYEAKAHYNGGMGKWELRYLYSLVRETKPNNVLETGICNGLSSAVILYAMHQNEKGHLYSIDLPEEDLNLGMTQFDEAAFSMIPKGKKVGWLVPDFLHERWSVYYGDSLAVIPELVEEFDLFIHDSLHTKEHVLGELKLVKPKLSDKAFIIVDDVNWHDGFEEFCSEKRLLYGYITPRMGIARLRE